MNIIISRLYHIYNISKIYAKLFGQSTIPIVQMSPLDLRAFEQLLTEESKNNNDVSISVEEDENIDNRRSFVSSSLKKASNLLDKVNSVETGDYISIQSFIDKAKTHINKVTDDDFFKYPNLVGTISPDLERIKTLQDIINNNKISFFRDTMIFAMD